MGILYYHYYLHTRKDILLETVPQDHLYFVIGDLPVYMNVK